MIITGTDGNDTGIYSLFGSDQPDLINGLKGNDNLFGNGGNDILVGGPGYHDMIDGGSGSDTVSYAWADGSLDPAHSRFEISLHDGYGDLKIDNFQTGTGLEKHDSIGNVENVWGSDVTDYINGSSVANDLSGRGGNDYLSGLGGADHLSGGDGIDTASYWGSAAGVSVNLATGTGSGGDAAGDTLVGIEALSGSDFNDTLIGDAGDNRLEGMLGADYLSGGAGYDTAVYFDRKDEGGVVVNLATGTGSAGPAAGDTLVGIEAIQGSLFNDTLTGNAGENQLQGMDGQDYLYGGAGSDHLSGGTGNDLLIGATGMDFLQGGDGKDTFRFAFGDTGVSKATADVISDFNHSDGDLIRVDHDRAGHGYTFVGKAAITDDHQIRYEVSNGDTYLQIHATANTADEFVHLDGAHQLSQSDFLL